MTGSKKIYIKAYTRMNFGDDLFVYILCARYPNITFYLNGDEKYLQAFKQIPNLILNADIKQISIDAIVYIGGSIFIENSNDSINRVLELKKEIIKETIPTYIIGANFGPYMTEKYVDVVKNDILRNATGVTFRDKYSYELFKDIPSVNQALDVVFSLDAEKNRKETKKEIGLSVIHHLNRPKIKENYQEYLDKLADIIKHYISKGYRVKLLSFCEYEKDTIAISELLEKLDDANKGKVKVINYSGDIEAFLGEISCLECFVTTRFHSMVLGLRYEIPIIPICYSDKMKNVLHDIHFDKQRIYDFDTLSKIKYEQKPEVFRGIPFEDANRQFEKLEEFLAE